jgi:hypothetical protein
VTLAVSDARLKLLTATVDAGTMSDPASIPAVENALRGIRTASASDLSVPEQRTALEEDARRAGATFVAIGKAAHENQDWPS